MKFKFILKSLFLFCLIFKSLNIFSQEALTIKDIPKIMQQILSQHVDKSQMTKEVIKNSLRAYIDEFDPYRIYLLESEVDPFANISDEELKAVILQYEKNDYSIYERLNDLFEKAISRSRGFRQEIEKNSTSFFQTALNVDIQDPTSLMSHKHFAKDDEELKTRIKNQFTVLVQTEKKRYGDAYVLQNRSSIIDIYEKRLHVFENQYIFDQHEKQRAVYGAEENLFVMHILKALASSLDAHTEFYNPKEAYDMKMHLENSFQGVGISLQDSPEGIIINSLVPGAPAAKSGLVKTDDQIIEIDGKNVSEKEVDEAAEMLQGKAGSSVTLLLKRKTQEGLRIVEKQFTVKLKREAISIDEDRVIFTFEHFGNGIIGKIALNSFYQNDQGISSENDVRDAILSLKKSGNLRGLILDLRENTGGFLSQAVKVVGLFITNGVVVISKYSSGEEKFFRDMDGKRLYDGPLIILTSKMTASAAEIVAESLQDYGVAIVVGDEHTYGKGTVQTQTVTQDQASSFFKVTIGKYYTVSGKTPQLKGVIADVFVPGKYSHERIGEAYLGSHTLKNDQIEPSFNDKLQDVDPASKAWYLHYYVPTEQKKIELWKEMIPTLKKNSGYRIAQNRDYQFFLRNLKHGGKEVPFEDNFLQEGNLKGEDFQMQEAVSVLKDMIYLESKKRVDEKKESS